MKKFSTLWRLIVLGVLLVVTLGSAPRRPFPANELLPAREPLPGRDSVPSRPLVASAADPSVVAFVRPGLTITINSAAIAPDGTITVIYTVTDPNNLPLDTTGATTPGAITLSYVAAVLPNGQQDYTTYTTRAASGAALPATQQPGADSGGVATQVGSGQYQYVFKTKAPVGFDATATHTIGIYGSRNLTVYNLATNYASASFNFVPNGAKVTHVHDIIETASCNTCHDQLSAHGGSRRGMNMCVLCHQPQLFDPVDGKSLDAKVFFHKLHMGARLPSVKAGGSYKVTNAFGTSDYSAVVFPADPSDPRRCVTCHSQTTKAAQATAYLTNPTRTACGSCHDDVNFATGANHPGGVQNDDTQCSTCHIPYGSDFDASIGGAHVAPTASNLLSGLSVTIKSVTNGNAGNKPVVTFTVQDNGGNAVPLSKLGSISFTMAGPTTDYGYTTFGTATTPGYVTESATGATCSNGLCTYTFIHNVPSAATGTYAIGAEARRTEVVLPGTPSQQSITYGAPNPVAYFSVDGSTLAPRRGVVALSNCNQCHVSLQLHGTLRNNTEYCVMCHNPSNTDVSVRGNAVVAADKAAPPQGINFNLLVHRIHDGVNLAADKRTYVVVGFGGSHNDFSNTLFPAMGPTGSPTELRNCSLCHVNTSEQNLPLGLNPVVDPQGFVNPISPISSACSGCHADISSASHMLSNTTTLGEACTVCHTADDTYAVTKVHAEY